MLFDGLFSIFLALCAVLVTFIILHYLAGITSSQGKAVAKMPGMINLPLLGSATQLKADESQFLLQIVELCGKYGPVWKTWLGNSPLVVIGSAEFAEPILRGMQHIEKSMLYDFLKPWLGSGLTTAGGSKWKSRRRLLTPTFHFEILKEMVDVFREQTYVLVENLSQVADGKSVTDIFPIISLYALDNICETAMGKSINAQRGGDLKYVNAVLRISQLILGRQKKPWEWSETLYKWTSAGHEHNEALEILHNFTDSVIVERRKAGESKPLGQSDHGDKKRRKAFLDLLITAKDEEGNSLSNDDIREEVDTFMFAGHDTTSAAMSWCLYLIGKHPEVQQNIHDEIDKVLADSRTPNFEQLQSHALPYLEMVIKEALRLYPSVPMFGRNLTEDCVLGDYVLPKGTMISIIAYAIHRDPKHWPEPERFIPERFSKENQSGRHPYAYIPFSAGPRNCIGQKFAQFEEIVTLAALLKQFSIKSIHETYDEVQPVPELILRPRKGIQVILTKR